MADLVEIHPAVSRSDAARALRQLNSGDADADHCRIVLVETLNEHTAAHITAVAIGAVEEQMRVIVVTLQPNEGDLALSILDLVDDVLDWDDTVPAALSARFARDRLVRSVLDDSSITSRAIGRSPPYLAALRAIAELALGPELPVLVNGETGTGKEIAANLLHTLSARRSGPFVIVDCTTIVPTLSGSEFFGHERGAFTGAVSTRSGAIAAAHGGTLFLDEIGELPILLQAELLRVLQQGTYKRVGGDRWLESDFRLISATNRDLEHEVNAGRFRADLFHRIAGAKVCLPPLRERPDDIEPLFRLFFAEAASVPCPPVSRLALRRLRSRRWPGNVRELRQVASLVASRHVGPGPITPGSLPRNHPSIGSAQVIDLRAEQVPADPSPPATPERAQTVITLDPAPAALLRAVRHLLDEGHSLTELRQIVSDTAVDLALAEAGGSTHTAAQRLGVSDRAVQARRSAARSSGTTVQ